MNKELLAQLVAAGGGLAEGLGFMIAVAEAGDEITDDGITAGRNMLLAWHSIVGLISEELPS